MRAFLSRAVLATIGCSNEATRVRETLLWVGTYALLAARTQELGSVLPAFVSLRHSF